MLDWLGAALGASVVILPFVRSVQLQVAGSSDPTTVQPHEAAAAASQGQPLSGDLERSHGPERSRHRHGRPQNPR
jgi:hypothetical protein